MKKLYEYESCGCGVLENEGKLFAYDPQSFDEVASVSAGLVSLIPAIVAWMDEEEDEDKVEELRYDLNSLKESIAYAKEKEAARNGRNLYGVTVNEWNATPKELDDLEVPHCYQVLCGSLDEVPGAVARIAGVEPLSMNISFMW